MSTIRPNVAENPSHQPSKTVQTAASDKRADRIFLIGLFVAAVVANLYLVTRSWHSGFLIGHEFRQAQTAIISYYIDKQNNFSIHYETPIIGKPWEFPLEFPLYQWAVVILSRLTHWPHYESARAVGVASLYLTLPALYLLLGRAGMPARRRLIALAVMLATPVYIFYSRTFLMDVTAMMFSAWFLAAFVETMCTRKLSWLLVCAVAGSAGGLIKSVVLFVWLVPGAMYGAWCLWRAWKDRQGWGAIGKIVAWGLGAAIVPVALVDWWIRFTDHIKENHASAYIFTSKGLAGGNFGTFELSARFSKQVWTELLRCWSEGFAAPWIIAAVILVGVLFRGVRWRVLGAFGLFLAAQLTFPYAYAYQDYYFTACMAFLVCAVGFALSGVFSSAMPRWIRWPLMLAPFAGMYFAYAGYYWQEQKWESPGGTGLTVALRDYLPRTSVVVVAGGDWAAIIPYYSQHRALMIRNGLEANAAYVDRAFRELEGEDIAALVMIGPQRQNEWLVRTARKKFNLDSHPTFTWQDNADVFVSNFYRDMVLTRMQIGPLPEGIKISPDVLPREEREKMIVTIPPGRGAGMFGMFQPVPSKYRFRFGYNIWQVDGADVLNAHPDSDLWVPVPPGAKEIVCSFGMLPGSYQGPDKTTGAEFAIDLEGPDGHARTVWVRYLDPANTPADRGTLKETIKIDPKPDETLVFRTRPNGGYAFDWCYWAKVEVH